MPLLKLLNQLKAFSLLFIFLILLSSCGSRKDIVYYQNSDKAKEINSSFELKVKSGDLLSILVNTKDNEAGVGLNLPIPIIGNANSGIVRVEYQNYLVDNLGFIEYPILGKIMVAGLSKSELINYLKQQFKPYLKADPIITINILNFKIAVTGEVARPGSFSVTGSERVSLPDALALAGDLTIFGKRTNIIVLRDINGVKTINRIDITKTDFINSEFYYLTQNDVVYVEPNKTRINASAVGPNTSVIFSSISLLITIVTLAIKL